jgi:glycosyltransferase involved in cell wall biosynthesis
MKPTISVVVPCYNEKERILSVVSAIKKSSYSPEIIVVDDGSDASSKNILSQLTGIKLITHPKNLGKSQALLSGLLASRGKIIVFVDSDLVNFTPDHLHRLIKPILDGYDMSIGDIRHKILFFFQTSGYSAFCSGQRAFKKQILKKNLDTFSPSSYIDGLLVEIKMNQKYFGRKKIAKVLLDGVETSYKISKAGISGLLNDYRVMCRILKYLGPKEELRQLKFVRQLPYLSN